MLDAIRFVRGAVKDTDTITPVLTHFYINKGRIQGTDGRLHLDIACPDLTFEAVVPAERFLRAVDACEKEPTFRFTDGGKLVIESKPFKAFLPHLTALDFPAAVPSGGRKHKMSPTLIPVLRTLLPFLSTDASRAWAGTILFHKETGQAFAANNAIIAVHKAEQMFHADIQLPIFTVKELIRIADPPEHYSMDEVGITFYWGDRWLRSSLINAEWPVKTAVNYLTMKGTKVPIPDRLQSSINKIIPFCSDPKFPIIHFTKNGISTAQGETSAEVAGFDVGETALRADNIAPMLAVSTHMAVGDKVVLFWGKDFRGFMAPLRTA